MNRSDPMWSMGHGLGLAWTWAQQMEGGSRDRDREMREDKMHTIKHIENVASI
jgi:hypothetical protein